LGILHGLDLGILHGLDLGMLHGLDLGILHGLDLGILHGAGTTISWAAVDHGANHEGHRNGSICIVVLAARAYCASNQEVEPVGKKPLIFVCSLVWQ
jgi:hypothetical protein